MRILRITVSPAGDGPAGIEGIDPMTAEQEQDAIFVKRMAPHIAKGLSFEDAGRAVLADDRRIVDAVLNNPKLRKEICERMATKIWCDINGRRAWPTSLSA